MLNRSALVIRARQPFLDWLLALPDPPEVTLADVNRDNPVYLLPAFEEEHEIDEIVSAYHEDIFAELLGGWWTDEDDWPEPLDLDTFRAWFDVAVHSVVLDMVAEPLDADELDELEAELEDLEDLDEEDALDLAALTAFESLEQVEELLDRDLVRDTVVELFMATDARDWDRVEGCFSPRVLFDMTSVAGGEAALRTPHEIAADWRAGLQDLDAVHHQVGNFQIDVVEEDAVVTCYGVAIHYLATASGEKTRTFVGTYRLHLEWLEDRWAIDGFTFDLKFVTGDPDLGRA